MRTPYDWTRPPADDNPSPRRPRSGRLFRWFILAVNVAFLVWLFVTLQPTSSCAGLVGDALDACTTGEAVGTGIGMVLVVALWAFVDVILGVVYLVLRDRR